MVFIRSRRKFQAAVSNGPSRFSCGHSTALQPTRLGRCQHSRYFQILLPILLSRAHARSHEQGDCPSPDCYQTAAIHATECACGGNSEGFPSSRVHQQQIGSGPLLRSLVPGVQGDSTHLLQNGPSIPQCGLFGCSVYRQECQSASRIGSTQFALWTHVCTSKWLGGRNQTIAQTISTIGAQVAILCARAM